MLRRQGSPEIYKAVKVHSSLECCRGTRSHHTMLTFNGSSQVTVQYSGWVKTQIRVKVRIRFRVDSS